MLVYHIYFIHALLFACGVHNGPMTYLAWDHICCRPDLILISTYLQLESSLAYSLLQVIHLYLCLHQSICVCVCVCVYMHAPVIIIIIVIDKCIFNFHTGQLVLVNQISTRQSIPLATFK